MRIDELTADEFGSSMALLGEALESLLAGPVGKAFKEDAQAFGAKSADEKEAGRWAIDMIGKYVPKLLKSNVEDVFKLLAACDGQTLEEYKAEFTTAKLAADLNALKESIAEGGQLREIAAPFLD